MKVRRTKPIDTLYRDVENHDLVLANQAPLVEAISLQLNEPHFGIFATTPRRLATRQREPKEDRTAFLEVVEETDLDWKDASYAVGNVLQCWEYQETPVSVLDYPRYDDNIHRKTLDILRNQDITSRYLTNFKIDDSRDVAVVGRDLMTPLERSILPPNYTEVEPFTTETTELEPFRIFESKAAIVDALLDTIDEDNAEDVAVVLESGSSYSSLVESALEANDIPFHGGPGFMDQTHHRAFLQLLRVTNAATDLRTRDARALLNVLGVDVPIKHDEKHIRSLDPEGLEWLHEQQNSTNNTSFEELLNRFSSQIDNSLKELTQEIKRLGILDETITEESIGSLSFYFDRYEVPVERDNEGVLLADAQTTTYVDRPLVYYLGLDSGWNHKAPRRPWIDEDNQYRKHLLEFQISLQNGVDQYYLVQDSVGGHPVQPCIYFEELADREFERFSDLNSIPHTRTHRTTKNGFQRKPLDIKPRTIRAISQSRLNTYANCPRDYFFDKLLDQPDKDYFTEGNLYHDFAEFYATHPDKVDNTVVEQVVDYMLEEVEPFIRAGERESRRAKYQVALQNIMDYLDNHQPDPPELENTDGGFGDNEIAKLLGHGCDEPFTEHWFENEELGIKGSIDLVRSADELVDYKTGNKKKPYKVVRNAACNPPADKPDFQAVMYLAHHRTQVSDPDSLSFTFLHFLENHDDVVAGTPNLDDCISSVTYHDCSFHEYIQKESVYQFLSEEHYNDCVDTFNGLTYNEYQGVVSDWEPPDTLDKEEFLGSEFAETFTSGVLAIVGDCDADVENGCLQALRHFRNINRKNLFREDLDEFEGFVAERLEELNDRLAGVERFPVADLKDEPNERWLNNQDLLLRDD